MVSALTSAKVAPTKIVGIISSAQVTSIAMVVSAASSNFFAASTRKNYSSANASLLSNCSLKVISSILTNPVFLELAKSDCYLLS